MLPESEYRKLTAPESVALVGVTRRTGVGSLNPLEVLLKRGYRGRIYPVNRKGGTILGLPAYTHLRDVPEIPDLAVICAPRDAVPELFSECAAKGVKIVIITAQGFFDGDARGRLMQEEILDLAAQHQIRILGPNTLGIVNNFHNFCTSFIDFINPVKPIGLTCQTGTFYLGVSQLCTGVGIIVDTGNTTDIDTSDVLGHLARDPHLKVINIHMESLRDGKKFMAAAQDAVPLKPVVIYKTGTSPAGSLAASSHTGRLAGEDRVFDAAFQQCGLLRVQDVEELGDLNKAFCTFDGIKGNRVGVLSISGGAGVMAADACARYGLAIAPLSPSTYEQLNGLFPPWAHCANPMDMWPVAMFHGYHKAFRRIMEVLLEDPQVDALICFTGSFLPPEEDFLDVSGAIREVAGQYPDKPVVVSTCGNCYPYYEQELEKENTVVYYFTLERAARALASLYQYHHRIKRQKPPAAPPAPHPGQGAAAAILAGRGAGYLSQTDAFRLLEAYGIPTVRCAGAASLEEAVTAAEKIGYPVALKVLSPDIIHKSDVGGVRLNIGNAAQLAAAYTAMHAEIGRRQPDARIEGVLVQECLGPGTELLIGGKRDPQFGPVLAFGTGGIFTEIDNDITLRVAPLPREEISGMINETRVSKKLAGARGTAAVDREALVDCLAGFAQLLLEHPAIAEADVNPVLVHAGRIVALDARVALK